MVEKRDTNSPSSTQQSEITRVIKSIIAPWRGDPSNLDTPGEQLEGEAFLQNRKVLALIWLQVHLVCCIAEQLSGTPDFLPFGNAVLLASSLYGESFIDQITRGMYTYNYANKLFISSYGIDYHTAEDLLRFLRNQSQTWLKIIAQAWTYRTTTNSLMLYIEQGTGRYFYTNINNEDKQYKLVPSILPNQWIMLLTCQENTSRWVAPSNAVDCIVG